MAHSQLPTLLQFLPCETAAFDLSSNAWVLTRPLHTVSLPAGTNFPFLQDELWLYAQLTDAIGTHGLSVEFRMPMTQVVLGRSVPVPRAFPTNRLDVVEEVFQLTNLPIRSRGEYEFHLLANHRPLTPSVRLVVR